MTNASAGVLVCLMGGLALSVWWAITAREAYLNRKCGESFRVGLIRHARQILDDPQSPPKAISVATMWLGFVYDPATLLKQVLAFKRRDSKFDDSWIDAQCGKYATVIRDGTAHLAVLAVLEDRRLGTAMRTLIGQAPSPLPRLLQCS